MKNFTTKIFSLFMLFCFLSISIFAQIPKPSAPRSVTIPAVQEKKLGNGLQVAVVERKNVPLVSVRLLVKSGADSEDAKLAGLADMTASLLTKGTTTRTATQIAEGMEFLGGSIEAGAGWNSSTVAVNVMSDKLDQAMAILADVVLNPTFKQEELDLLKSQNLDGLKANLKQPGFLANYVASKYSFGEHPANGTPDSLDAIKQQNIVDFKNKYYTPDNSVLIFTGDITAKDAQMLANKYFGKWKNDKKRVNETFIPPKVASSDSIVNRFLVIDLPNSGQASVSYTKYIKEGRGSTIYFPASVMNSVLGGGYSARLNQEIRIKRGLSYGAGSGFAWRGWKTNFSTRTQTKNPSAAQVAELVVEELKKLTETDVAGDELAPRKAVLTGNFGRNLEANDGLAAQLSEFYSFGLSPSLLNSYMGSVEGVTDAQVKQFAAANLRGGDMIIVGDYSIFKDDLAKRFPNAKIEVIKADELDLSKDDLRK